MDRNEFLNSLYSIQRNSENHVKLNDKQYEQYANSEIEKLIKFYDSINHTA